MATPCIPLLPHQDPIGCGEYRFGLVDRGGLPLGELSGTTSYLWDRRLDDISQTAITLSLSDARPECCELLAQARTWRTDLVVFRNNETVWRGPLVEIDLGVEDVNLVGMDVLAWFDKRTIRELLDFEDEPGIDPVLIAEALLNHGLAIDDPGFGKFIYLLASDLKVKRLYEANSQYVMDALRDLADGTIDYTAVGRRIYIGPEESFGSLGRWGDKYFPDGYRVIESGLDAAGVVTVRGADLQGGERIVETVMGRPANLEYYGILERLINDTSITDDLSAREKAERFAAAGDIPPLIVRMDEGTLLSPETPVGINQLIPGVTIDFLGEMTCRPVRQRLRLQRVSVSDEGGETAGEKIRLTFSPVGSVDIATQVF